MMSVLQKFFAGRLVSDYNSVAKKITNITDQLDVIMDRASDEEGKLQEQMNELVQRKSEVQSVIVKSSKLKSNLNKLFE